MKIEWVRDRQKEEGRILESEVEGETEREGERRRHWHLLMILAPKLGTGKHSARTSTCQLTMRYCQKKIRKIEQHVTASKERKGRREESETYNIVLVVANVLIWP